MIARQALQALWRRTVVAAVLATLVAVPTAASAGERSGSNWNVVPGVDLTEASSLNAVATFGGDAAWAVGSAGVVGTTSERGLVARWDDSEWTEVAAPADVGLSGVSGVDDNDVWAVGSALDMSASTVIHWDGASWEAVPHVSASPTDPLGLYAVEAVNSDDVWAVGTRGTLFGGSGHIQRWDGMNWSEISVPQPPDALSAALTSVSSASSTNVWASGFAFDGFGFNPYFVRWNGSTWSLIEPPSHIVGGYNDIEVSGPNKVVAVGTAVDANFDPIAVVVTLDGNAWKQEKLPVSSAELNAVTVDAQGKVWVVGDLVGPGGHDDREPLIMRRHGRRWSVTTPVTEAGGLRAVAAIAGGGAWAVGATGVTDEGVEHLILGYRIGN